MSYRPSTQSRSTIYYPRPTKPGIWRSPGDTRGVRAVAALKGLLGLGTDVAPVATSPTGVVLTTDPAAYVSQPGSTVPAPDPSAPAPGTVTTSITATLPTQAPDGSMQQQMPVMTSTVTTPKKWYSFLETTKADGTVTGPLGMPWSTWLVGGGVAALVFASRNNGGGSSDESTPNGRRRRARRNRRHSRRNRRRSR